MNSEKNKFYIKFVDVTYNFVVGKLLIWNWFESQNIVLTSWILKFNI